jgi:GTP-binding protein
MQFHDVKLLISAAGKEQWPETDLPEVVFAGRSNAGKSTLINALINRKQMAYSGKTPGKTRLINFYEVDGRAVFADSPGYGYAAGIRQDAASFRRLMDPYFRLRPQLKGMILVLDSRRVPNEDDQLMVDYARNAHLAIAAAVTKTDKLNQSETARSLKSIRETLGISAHSAVAISAVNRKGLEELWTMIDSMVEK